MHSLFLSCITHTMFCSSFNYFFSFKSTLAIFMDATNSSLGIGDKWDTKKSNKDGISRYLRLGGQHWNIQVNGSIHHVKNKYTVNLLSSTIFHTYLFYF